MQYLLDTNVCIDVLRKREPALSRIRTVPRHACAISTVTTYELLTGAKRSKDPIGEAAKIRQFVLNVHELAFDPFAADRAAEVRADLERQGLVIGPYDLLLAGHIHYGYSGDVRRCFPGLQRCIVAAQAGTAISRRRETPRPLAASARAPGFRRPAR